MEQSSQPRRNQLSRIIFDSDTRLRSGWRFFAFFSLFLLTASFGSGVLGTIFSMLGVDIGANALLIRAGQPLIGLVTAILVGWFCLKFFEGLPFRALGAAFTKYWLKDLAVGCLLGAAAIGFAVAVAMLFGGLRFEYNAAAGSSAIWVTLAATFIIFTVGAAFEEALVRGYMFQTFVRSGLWWVALLLTSVLFAVGHIPNEGATVFSTINTGMAGIWLGLAYLKTRTLWLVLGLHFAWNWVQGSFFGIEVSGFDDFATAPILREIDNGPAWITGGDYGIEGGAACTIALIVITLVIWYWPFIKAHPEMAALTSPGAKDPKEELV